MHAEISIAALDERSADAAVELLAAQLREHDICTVEHELRAVVDAVANDARHGFMLLASAGDQAIGIAFAAAHLSAEHGGVVGWLEELYVSRDWRGRGTGARLLAEVIARAEGLRWRALELEVVAGHERAAALYLRHGFVAADRARYTRAIRSDA
jgi:GNAT superfamily N-acetyltransferase